MSETFGPVLQFRGIDGDQYKVSVLVVQPLDNQANDDWDVKVPAGSQVDAGKKLAEVPLQSPTCGLWRFDISTTLTQGLQVVVFHIAGTACSYHVPRMGESPRMAYVSCNGVSPHSHKFLLEKMGDIHERWHDINATHTKQPYHLLLMGGDQVYSDEIWTEVKQLKTWTRLPAKERFEATWNNELAKDVDAFFCSIYLNSWDKVAIQSALQSIPTIMMWDDHDIVDGWGSHPKELHGCEIYKEIFKIATQYFRLFQQQLAADETHPAAIPGQAFYSMGFRALGNISILVPDLRSERSPSPNQIVSKATWDAIYDWLAHEKNVEHLFVLSSVPVAYLKLEEIEKLLSSLPGQQELEDDLRDHWRSYNHIGERKRLLNNLFSHSQAKRQRVTIISGDVHVGAACIVESTKQNFTGNANIINQLVSTGVVHPGPSSFVRYVLESIGDKPETIDRGVTATMFPIAGRGRYLIGRRNWLSLEPDDLNRIWANWHVEGEDDFITKVIHPCDYDDYASRLRSVAK